MLMTVKCIIESFWLFVDFFTEMFLRVKYRKKVPLGIGTDTGTVPVQMWMVPNPSHIELHFLIQLSVQSNAV